MYVNDDDDDDLDSDCVDSGFGMTSGLIGTDDESVTDPALSSLSFSSFSSPGVFFDLGAISNDFFPIADAIPVIVVVVALVLLLMMYTSY